MNNDINLRNLILNMLLEVEDGLKSHVVLNDTFKRLDQSQNGLDKQKKSFVTRIFQGTVEKQIELDYIINQFSKTNTSKMKSVILEILRMSVYQIKYMDSVPNSAAVNEAVKLAGKRKLTNLKGFVNGVLRNIERNINNIKYPEKFPENLSIKYSVPTWIIKMWDLQYGDAEEILKGLDTEFKTTVRVNTSKVNIEDLVNNLVYSGIEVERSDLFDDVLLISNFDSLADLDVFKSGMITVQNSSSILVGLVASPEKDNFILDVCAAPGGKSLHIAELLNGSGRVEARDLSEKKVNLICENTERIGYKNIETKVFDATVFCEDLDGKADIVICDLPCSGLGVIGNKSDIKNNLKEEQLEELVKLQREILKNASRYVKSGGKLIYSTCTINKNENELNANWITSLGLEKLELNPNEMLNVVPENVKEIDGYIQVFPGHNMDGFFISAFIKK